MGFQFVIFIDSFMDEGMLKSVWRV